MWKRFDKDIGLLILRLGIGVLFIAFGYPKITAGPQLWEKIGGAMANLGVTFQPTFWGFMASLAEFGGGILLILGFLFRPALLLMMFTMIVAIVLHCSKGDGFGVYANPLGYLIVFAGLFISGPGKYSLKLRAEGQL
jgi:putative oxidoreductase